MTLKQQQLVLHQLNHLKILLNHKLAANPPILGQYLSAIPEQARLDLKEVEEGIKIIEEEPVGKIRDPRYQH